LAYYPTL